MPEATYFKAVGLISPPESSPTAALVSQDGSAFQNRGFRGEPVGVQPK